MRIDGACHCGRLSYEADVDPDKAAPKPSARIAAPGCTPRLKRIPRSPALAPKSQVWCRSALPWVMDLGAVKQHAKQSM
jgi:hypothetical protein